MGKSTQKFMKDGELDPVAELKLEGECTGPATTPLRSRFYKAHCGGLHPRGDVN